MYIIFSTVVSSPLWCVSLLVLLELEYCLVSPLWCVPTGVGRLLVISCLELEDCSVICGGPVGCL